MSNIIPSEESVQKLITSNVAKATTIAALPIPFVDCAGVMFVQFQMIEKLAYLHGREVDNKHIALIATGLSAILAKLITESFNGVSKKTKINKIFGKAMVSATVVSIFTTGIGELFHLHFKNGGTLDDFGLDSVSNYAQAQIATEKLSIHNIGGSLVSSVMKQI
jgi:uncharacterized protein (DUF697 family)